MLRRILTLVYGVGAYALTLATLLYTAGFIGGFLTPTRLDGPRRGPVATALAVDLGLIALFALQHSGMARPAFKRWWTRYVPVQAERSTYVLLSCAALLLLLLGWRPVGGVVWEIGDAAGRAALYAAYGAGWLLVFWATFLINHFDLFGLRQVWLNFRGRPYSQLRFGTPSLYRLVRHPLYVGWLMVFWSTPHMTVAHLVFAAGLTTYIVAAIRWEERDLMAAHSEYAAYRRRVPMLFPRRPRLTPALNLGADGGPAPSSAGLGANPAS